MSYSEKELIKQLAKNPNIKTAEAVSYTHLDVYKRQVVMFSLLGNLLGNGRK